MKFANYELVLFFAVTSHGRSRSTFEQNVQHNNESQNKRATKLLKIVVRVL